MIRDIYPFVFVAACALSWNFARDIRHLIECPSSRLYYLPRAVIGYLLLLALTYVSAIS